MFMDSHRAVNKMVHHPHRFLLLRDLKYVILKGHTDTDNHQIPWEKMQIIIPVYELARTIGDCISIILAVIVHWINIAHGIITQACALPFSKTTTKRKILAGSNTSRYCRLLKLQLSEN